MLLSEKEEKNKQNNRYKQLLEEYKKVNEDITNELSLLRITDHGDCPLQNINAISQPDSYFHQNQNNLKLEEMNVKVRSLENELKMHNFLKVENASLKSKVFNL